MKPLVYKGLRKNVNRSEWVSSDEIKQSYSQIRLLAVENDTRKVICGDWECEEKQRFELRRASCRKGKQK